MALYFCGKQSWRAWLLSLGTDLASYYCLTYPDKLSKIEKVAKNKRRKGREKKRGDEKKEIKCLCRLRSNEGHSCGCTTWCARRSSMPLLGNFHFLSLPPFSHPSRAVSNTFVVRTSQRRSTQSTPIKGSQRRSTAVNTSQC